MTPERWNRIEEIFDAAVALTPSRRLQFLDATCAGDAGLRRELDAMLQADAGGGSVISGVVAQEVRRAGLDRAEALDSRMVGRRFGPWRVTGIAGRGGMSAVYRAVRDDDRFQKQVALKILRGGLDSEFARARFRYERRILAQLEHPNIARLIDGGEAPCGDLEPDEPYLVMEFVEGAPITTYCSQRNLPLRDRLKLFRQVCEGVQYAHRNLVIHRDLKPGNILVNADGVPKLLDFGIAKLQSPDIRQETVAETSTGMRLMTPEYASPEQVRAEAVTTATDVYSLGAVLFELLTGERAHRLTGSDPLEMARVICETGIARPSTAAPEPLRRALAGDLDNIVLKAVSKEPERRYATVEQFSEDIRRFLEGRTVVARKDTLWYRAVKFIRRHRLWLAAASLAIAGLVAGLVSSVVSRQRAEHRFQQVRKLANQFLFQFDQEIRQVPGTTKAREMLVSTALTYLDSLTQDGGGDPQLRAELAQSYERIGDIQGMMGLPNLGRPADALASYRKSLAIKRGLIAEYPGNVNYTRTLSLCLERTSFLQTAAGKLDDARASLQEALRIVETNLRGRRAEAPDLRLLANGNVYLAFNYDRAGDAVGAAAAARRGLEWMKQYAEANPIPRARSDLARAYGQLGSQQLTLGDLEGARQTLGEERARRLDLAKALPNDMENLRELSMSEHHLGNLYGQVHGASFGLPGLAIPMLSDAVAITERLAAADSASTLAREDLPDNYGRLADVLRDLDRPRALSYYRKALAIADLLPDSERDMRGRQHAECQTGISEILLLAGDRIGARRSAMDALDVLARLDPPEGNFNKAGLWGRAYIAAAAAVLASGDLAGAGGLLTHAVAVYRPFESRAATNTDVASDLSLLWETQEEFFRKSGRVAEAVAVRARRLAFWQSWNATMPSAYTRRQEERAKKSAAR